MRDLSSSVLHRVLESTAQLADRGEFPIRSPTWPCSKSCFSIQRTNCRPGRICSARFPGQRWWKLIHLPERHPPRQIYFLIRAMLCRSQSELLSPEELAAGARGERRLLSKQDRLHSEEKHLSFSVSFDQSWNCHLFWSKVLRWAYWRKLQLHFATSAGSPQRSSGPDRMPRRTIEICHSRFPRREFPRPSWLYRSQGWNQWVLSSSYRWRQNLSRSSNWAGSGLI